MDGHSRRSRGFTSSPSPGRPLAPGAPVAALLLQPRAPGRQGGPAPARLGPAPVPAKQPRPRADSLRPSRAPSQAGRDTAPHPGVADSKTPPRRRRQQDLLHIDLLRSMQRLPRPRIEHLCSMCPASPTARFTALASCAPSPRSQP